MMIVYHEKAPEYAATFQDIDRDITDRISSLFCLRTIGSVEEVEGLTRLSTSRTAGTCLDMKSATAWVS